MRLPSSDASRAVLIGTGSYKPNSGFPDLPSVNNNLTDLAKFLRDHTGLSHVAVQEDPSSSADIVDALRPAIRDATDVLLFYFAGHGVALPSGDVGLTHTNSRADGGSWSTLHYSDIRQEIRSTRAPIKIVILDCCHSGRAFGTNTLTTTDDNEALKELAQIEGAYVLTATNTSQRFASAVGSDNRTAFTGALLDILTEGVESSEEYLTMRMLFPLLRSKLNALGAPAPRATGSNTVVDVALTRNRLLTRKTSIVVDADNLLASGLYGGLENALHFIRLLPSKFRNASIALFTTTRSLNLANRLSSVADSIGGEFNHVQRKGPGGMDVAMTIKVATELSQISELVIMSGDDDLLPLLEYCQASGVKAVVVADPSATSVRLADAADIFIDISALNSTDTDIRGLIEEAANGGPPSVSNGANVIMPLSPPPWRDVVEELARIYGSVRAAIDGPAEPIPHEDAKRLQDFVWSASVRTGKWLKAHEDIGCARQFVLHGVKARLDDDDDVRVIEGPEIGIRQSAHFEDIFYCWAMFTQGSDELFAIIDDWKEQLQSGDVMLLPLKITLEIEGQTGYSRDTKDYGELLISIARGGSNPSLIQ